MPVVASSQKFRRLCLGLGLAIGLTSGLIHAAEASPVRVPAMLAGEWKITTVKFAAIYAAEPDEARHKVGKRAVFGSTSAEFAKAICTKPSYKQINDPELCAGEFFEIDCDNQTIMPSVCVSKGKASAELDGASFALRRK